MNETVNKGMISRQASCARRIDHRFWIARSERFLFFESLVVFIPEIIDSFADQLSVKMLGVYVVLERRIKQRRLVDGVSGLDDYSTKSKARIVSLERASSSLDRQLR